MTRRTLLVLALLAAATAAAAQTHDDPQALMTAQKDALAKLAFMDGVWRGPAWTILPDGRKSDVTQTERIGPFLGGCVKVIEGRGYRADGTVGFNAMGIVSFDPAKQAYTMRSYAQGRAGDFAFTPTAHGYVWEIPAGKMTMRYTATIGDSTWREIGERILEGREPSQFFEMNLRRVGDTKWPGENPVPMK
jgi:hypothetical protein